MKRKGIYHKIELAENLIRKSLKQSQKVVVACSFGKNSMVVLHMVRKYSPDVHVLFNDTLMEYPEIYKYKKEITKKWNLNVIQTRPTKTFWWIVENYGFPLFSRKGHKDASKNCCRYLKEYPVLIDYRLYTKIQNESTPSMGIALVYLVCVQGHAM